MRQSGDFYPHHPIWLPSSRNNIEANPALNLKLASPGEKSIENILNTFSDYNYTLLLRQKLEQLKKFRYQYATVG